MEKRTLTQHLILTGILGMAALLCAFTTRGRMNSSPPVEGELPLAFGPYRSSLILHCQSLDCMHSLTPQDDSHPTACPDCGGALDPVSLPEKQMLPADTRIRRRLYTAPSGLKYAVAIVEGGYERRSIHKPQVCLVGQGHTITAQRRMQIPLKDTNVLPLTVMEMDGGQRVFAYWFTDGSRLTSSHLARLFWIAWDGIVHNERRRWAYISITMPGVSSSSNAVNLKQFTSDLYPQLMPNAR
jgi:hypothetical protein